MKYVDLVIIGAGPAGLAAAAEAMRQGLSEVLVLERNDMPGGILNQCIHDGFGVERFGAALSGPEYVGRFEADARNQGAHIICSAMVTRITPEREVTYVTRQGQFTLAAGAVILATGCRERTRGAISVAGTRPAGIYTAGVVQHLVNLQNISVGKRAVILGSGDIGLIMARRLTLEGMEIACVLEKLPYCSGLARNVRQCLDDYGIPLRLSTTVTEIRGREHLESVVVCAFDASGAPIPGTEQEIPCDTLILSVGLIPENELAKACGVAIDPATSGALVDGRLMANVPGIFSCGNCLHVHDLVDFVSEEAEAAAKNAAAFVHGTLSNAPEIPIAAGEGVRYVLPRSLVPGAPATLSMRVRAPGACQSVLVQKETGETLARRKFVRLSPAEMLRLPLQPGQAKHIEVVLRQEPDTRKNVSGDMICTVCPNGCALSPRLHADGSWTVEGASCKRGVDFAIAEMTAPVRSLTTSVPVTGGTLPLLSLRSASPLPKAALRSTVQKLTGLCVPAPVVQGERLTLAGVEWIATRAVPGK